MSDFECSKTNPDYECKTNPNFELKKNPDSECKTNLNSEFKTNPDSECSKTNSHKSNAKPARLRFTFRNAKLERRENVS